jgi:hypothetical protein
MQEGDGRARRGDGGRAALGGETYINVSKRGSFLCTQCDRKFVSTSIL